MGHTKFNDVSAGSQMFTRNVSDKKIKILILMVSSELGGSRSKRDPDMIQNFFKGEGWWLVHCVCRLNGGCLPNVATRELDLTENVFNRSTGDVTS